MATTGDTCCGGVTYFQNAKCSRVTTSDRCRSEALIVTTIHLFCKYLHRETRHGLVARIP